MGMTGSANPTEAPGDSGFLSPKPDAQPVDHCFRCGVETPAGVGLCDEHNRGHLSGPSSTQMHATIFIGIVTIAFGLSFQNFVLGKGDWTGGESGLRVSTGSDSWLTGQLAPYYLFLALLVVDEDDRHALRRVVLLHAVHDHMKGFLQGEPGMLGMESRQPLLQTLPRRKCHHQV